MVDDLDTCPLVGNPGQGDEDPCLEDTDGDGLANFEDNCPEVANPGQEEAEPGLGVACAVAVGGGE